MVDRDPVTNAVLLEELRANRRGIDRLRDGQEQIRADLVETTARSKSNQYRIRTGERRMWTGVWALLMALASLAASGYAAAAKYWLPDK